MVIKIITYKGLKWMIIGTILATLVSYINPLKNLLTLFFVEVSLLIILLLVTISEARER